MESIKHFINVVSTPKLMFTFLLVVFFFVFPPTDRFFKISRALKFDFLWTRKGGAGILLFLLSFFAFGLTDHNFRLIVTKPDNVPIVGLIFLVFFFLWLAMSQAIENDKRLDKGLKPNEFEDAKEKVLVWPDLVYIEFICLISVAAFLIIWSLILKAPLEGPANPTVSPNPSKAPWYFLGLQEMLVYFDPWIAGVLFPTLILFWMMCIPYLDGNPQGGGFYSFKRRKMGISIFLFFWLLLWIFLIMTGTFLRGPNWNFFGPFEFWDVHKLEALTNVNISELVYMIILKRGVPDNIFLREIVGFLMVGGYFLLLPPILAKTWLKNVYARLGPVRYSIFIVLLLIAISLPVKMYLRWFFNIKYIIAIPEFFFNI